MPSPFDCKPVKSWMFMKGNPGRKKKKKEKKADLFEFPVTTAATSNGVIKF